MVQLLEEQKRDTQLSMNCVQIGIIQSFDADHQTATIKLALKQVTEIAPDGTKTIKEYPLILKCPVMTLFGGVDFMSMPIAAGDNCIVLFNDREIDNWLAAGNGQTPTTPRLHDISDAIAIVGIRPLTNSIATYLTNGIRLSHGGGNAKMDFTDNLISSLATLFIHHGNMTVTGDVDIEGDTLIEENLHVEGGFTVDGDVDATGGTMHLKCNVTQDPAKSIQGGSLHATNGANGTYTIVTVVDGIVISGT